MFSSFSQPCPLPNLTNSLLFFYLLISQRNLQQLILSKIKSLALRLFGVSIISFIDRPLSICDILLFEFSQWTKEADNAKIICAVYQAITSVENIEDGCLSVFKKVNQFWPRQSDSIDEMQILGKATQNIGFPCRVFLLVTKSLYVRRRFSGIKKSSSTTNCLPKM